MKKYFGLIFLIFLSTAAQAGPTVISKKEIHALIGFYPASGSQEAINDEEILFELQRTRSQQSCEIAASQSKLNIDRVFSKPNGPLTKSELQRLQLKLISLQGIAGINIIKAKDMYKRPRPYLKNPNIRPCIDLESSSSYPSGHAAVGRAVGRYLSKIYPDRESEIMRAANQVGTNRMLGGVHYPSDVFAGQKLGDLIARNFTLHQR